MFALRHGRGADFHEEAKLYGNQNAGMPKELTYFIDFSYSEFNRQMMVFVIIHTQTIMEYSNC
jgi:hypothetical protein